MENVASTVTRRQGQVLEKFTAPPVHRRCGEFLQYLTLPRVPMYIFGILQDHKALICIWFLGNMACLNLQSRMRPKHNFQCQAEDECYATENQNILLQNNFPRNLMFSVTTLDYFTKKAKQREVPTMPKFLKVPNIWPNRAILHNNSLIQNIQTLQNIWKLCITILGQILCMIVRPNNRPK